MYKHKHILDAIRAGHLDALERVADKHLLTAAYNHNLIIHAIHTRQWHVALWLVSKHEQLDERVLATWSRVHVVAARGDTNALGGVAVEELKETRTRDKMEMSVLHVAAVFGHVEMVEFVVGACGGDVLESKAGLEDDRATAVEFASYGGHVEVVERLVQLGAKVDGAGRSLMRAARAGDVPVLECLLRLGANTECRTVNLETALHRAVPGNVEALDVLVKQGGMDVDVQGFMGTTALHDAAGSGLEPVVRRLLQLGAHVDARNDDGQTALLVCVYQQLEQTESIVRLLLQAGADRNAKDRWGETAGDQRLLVDDYVEATYELLDTYFPITWPMTQMLLGLRGPTDSPLTRFAAHDTYEPRVLALVKCFLSGEDKASFTQLQEEANAS